MMIITVKYESVMKDRDGRITANFSIDTSHEDNDHRKSPLGDPPYQRCDKGILNIALSQQAPALRANELRSKSLGLAGVMIILRKQVLSSANRAEYELAEKEIRRLMSPEEQAYVTRRVEYYFAHPEDRTFQCYEDGPNKPRGEATIVAKAVRYDC